MAQTLRFHERLQPALKVAPVRPAYAAGARAATATVAPLILGYWLGQPAVTWASLAGFSVSLADRGGAYSARAASMGSLLLLGAAAAVLGGLAGQSAWEAVPFLFVVATLTSLARVYGMTASVVGGSVATTFLISIALPALSAGEAIARGEWFVLGSVWAMALSLVLWPISPYRPARLDVARCYRALGGFASHLASRADRGILGATGDFAVMTDRSSVRESLEAARATLVAMRRGRQDGGRGERLLVLLEIADRSFATLLAAGEVLDSVPPFAAAAPVRRAADRALSAFASTAHYVERVVGEEPDAPAPAPGWSGALVRDALREMGQGVSSDGIVLARAAYERVATLLDHLHSYAMAAGETACDLDAKVSSADASYTLPPQAALTAERASIVAPLRDAFGRDSVALKHALRVGIVTAIAVWVTSALDIHRGYWVTLTVLVVLQPQAGATLIRAVQRVVGTVLGGVLAAGIAWAVHDTRGILVVVFALATISVALLPVNYAAFSVFLTPTFVLLAEASAGDWHLAHLRILNTLLGGALALAGTRLLWPSSGRARVEEELATALAALRDYMARIAAYEREGGDATALQEIAAARRAVGLATLNAEGALQWRLGELGAASSGLEPLLAATTYTRRMTAAATALTWTGPATAPVTASAAVERFAAAAAEALGDLAEALRERRSPGELPEWMESGIPEEASQPEVDPLLRAQLERAGRQLATLHGAVSRLFGGRERAGRPEDVEGVPETAGVPG